MKRAILFVLSVMMIITAGAQKKKETSGALANISYCLPKISYKVEVTLKHIKFIPGPYQKYAEKELGLKPEMYSKESWEIKSVTVASQAVPDEKAIFSAGGDSHALLLSLTAEGFLAGVSGGEGGIYYEDLVMRYDEDSGRKNRTIDIMHLNTYNHLKEVLDTNYTYQEVDKVMKKIWDPLVSYIPKNEKDNVEEAVSEIFRIRSERMKLLEADNGVPDGKSLEILLEEFDRMEEGYLSLFIGRREVSQIVKVFECVPEKADEPVTVFRFSEENGIANKRDVSAIAYVLQLQHVVMLDSSSGSLPTETQSGIYYRVPAVAELKLMRATEEIASFKTIIPQLGSIKKFPADIIINEGLSLEFYPKYGSLKSINKNK